jgi:hypothetical protein
MTPTDSITIISTHSIALTPEAIEDAHMGMWGELPNKQPGTVGDQQMKDVLELLESLRLVVIQVSPHGATPDFRKIHHPHPTLTPDNWQVPWDEHVIDSSQGLWAFYLHFVNPHFPLRTAHGDLRIPEPTPLPPHFAVRTYEHPG